MWFMYMAGVHRRGLILCICVGLCVECVLYVYMYVFVVSDVRYVHGVC